jgi:predicted HTH transcriptional regulator
MQIVEWIIKEGMITNRDVRKVFNLSNRAALDEISKLIELDVLKQEGSGRSVHYILV